MDCIDGATDETNRIVTRTARRGDKKVFDTQTIANKSTLSIRVRVDTGFGTFFTPRSTFQIKDQQHLSLMNPLVDKIIQRMDVLAHPIPV